MHLLGVSLVPSHKKSYENNKKTKWFDGLLMSWYTYFGQFFLFWSERCICYDFIWLQPILETEEFFPVSCMTSQFINFSNVNKDEMSELGTRSLFPGSLSAHFISMDHYRYSAHLANFQVRSSLYRSKKNSGSLSEKIAKTQNRS